MSQEVGRAITLSATSRYSALLLTACLPWTWVRIDLLAPLGIPWTALPFGAFILFGGLQTLQESRLAPRQWGQMRTSPWLYAALLAILSLSSTAWSDYPRTTLAWATQFSLTVLAFWIMSRQAYSYRVVVLRTYLISCTTMAVFGLFWSYVFTENGRYLRPFLGLMDPNTITVYFVTALAAGVALANADRGLRLAGNLICQAALVLAIALTASRAGALGALTVAAISVSLVVRGIWPIKRVVQSLATQATMTCVCLITATLLIARQGSIGQSLDPSNSALRLATIPSAILNDDSGRVSLWRLYFSFWPDYLPRGFGAGVDHQMLSLYLGVNLDTHNSALQLLVQLGVLGMLLGLAAAFFFAKRAMASSARQPGLLMSFALVPLVATLGIVSLGALWFSLAMSSLYSTSYEDAPNIE